jgi:hypothetical protein
MRAAVASLLCMVATAAMAADVVRLPDGSAFTFWERPLTFSRTYYVDGGASTAQDGNDGTQAHPFRTIGRAAEVLQPGERAVIAAGTYRECVRPARGGTGPDRMISYEAAPGAVVIVKGSEVLRDWQPSTDPIRGDAAPPRLWKHELAGALFSDAYNPFGMVNLPGDWSWLDTKRVDMGPYLRRRGLVFVDGKPLEPVEQYRELGSLPLTRLQSGMQGGNGLPARARGGPIMQEIGGSPDARSWIEQQGNVVHIRVPSGDPSNSLVEITAREQAFAPRTSGLGYIRIKGLTFQHAGNAFPPPQRGLVSTNGGHHWIIEGNTIEWANGVGLDIGAQHWTGPRDSHAGDSQVVRGNTIRYVGVEGLGGMGTANTLVEDNLIEWVGWQDAERGWEAAGAKFHFARNLLFRRNVVRHMRHANALWLDSANENSRISANVFADVLTVSAAIHMEMDRARNLIDDNIIWDVRNAEPGTPGQRGAAGSGIFLHASENQSIVHNLIARCDNVGVFSVARPERQNAGTGRGHRVLDNIFSDCHKGGIVFVDPDNSTSGNLYAGMPVGPGGSPGTLSVKLDTDRLRIVVTGARTLTKLPAPDGVDTDLHGAVAKGRRSPGPFIDPDIAAVRDVDPRAGRSMALPE